MSQNSLTSQITQNREIEEFWCRINTALIPSPLHFPGHSRQPARAKKSKPSSKKGQKGAEIAKPLPDWPSQGQILPPTLVSQRARASAPSVSWRRNWGLKVRHPLWQCHLGGAPCVISAPPERCSLCHLLCGTVRRGGFAARRVCNRPCGTRYYLLSLFVCSRNWN